MLDLGWNQFLSRLLNEEGELLISFSTRLVNILLEDRAVICYPNKVHDMRFTFYR